MEQFEPQNPGGDKERWLTLSSDPFGGPDSETIEAREGAEREMRLREEAFEKISFPVLAKISHALSNIYDQFYRPKSNINPQDRRLKGVYARHQRLLDKALQEDLERALVNHIGEYGEQETVGEDFQFSSFLREMRSRLEAREVLYREHIGKFMQSDPEREQKIAEDLTQQRDTMGSKAASLESGLELFTGNEKGLVGKKIRQTRQELAKLHKGIEALDQKIEWYRKTAEEEKGKLPDEKELFHIARWLEELAKTTNKFRSMISGLIYESLEETFSPVKLGSVEWLKLRGALQEYSGGKQSQGEVLGQVKEELSSRLGIGADEVERRPVFQRVLTNLQSIEAIYRELQSDDSADGKEAAA